MHVTHSPKPLALRAVIWLTAAVSFAPPAGANQCRCAEVSGHCCCKAGGSIGGCCGGCCCGREGLGGKKCCGCCQRGTETAKKCCGCCRQTQETTQTYCGSCQRSTGKHACCRASTTPLSAVASRTKKCCGCSRRSVATASCCRASTAPGVAAPPRTSRCGSACTCGCNTPPPPTSPAPNSQEPPTERLASAPLNVAVAAATVLPSARAAVERLDSSPACAPCGLCVQLCRLTI